MNDDNDLGLFSPHPSLGGERTPISQKEILTSIADQFQTLGFLASQQEETFQKISFLISSYFGRSMSETRSLRMSGQNELYNYQTYAGKTHGIYVIVCIQDLQAFKILPTKYLLTRPGWGRPWRGDIKYALAQCLSKK